MSSVLIFSFLYWLHWFFSIQVFSLYIIEWTLPCHLSPVDKIFHTHCLLLSFKVSVSLTIRLTKAQDWTVMNNLASDKEYIWFDRTVGKTAKINNGTTTKKYCPRMLSNCKLTYLAINGTWHISLYNSVAMLPALDTCLQSINQNLADTVVVNETQSLTNVRGVEPVTSSHWALALPPT